MTKQTLFIDWVQNQFDDETWDDMLVEAQDRELIQNALDNMKD